MRAAIVSLTLASICFGVVACRQEEAIVPPLTYVTIGTVGEPRALIHVEGDDARPAILIIDRGYTEKGYRKSENGWVEFVVGREGDASQERGVMLSMGDAAMLDNAGELTSLEPNFIAWNGSSIELMAREGAVPGLLREVIEGQEKATRAEQVEDGDAGDPPK